MIVSIKNKNTLFSQLSDQTFYLLAKKSVIDTWRRLSIALRQSDWIKSLACDSSAINCWSTAHSYVASGTGVANRYWQWTRHGPSRVKVHWPSLVTDGPSVGCSLIEQNKTSRTLSRLTPHTGTSAPQPTSAVRSHRHPTASIYPL